PPPRPPQSTIPQLTSLLINNAGALHNSPAHKPANQQRRSPGKICRTENQFPVGRPLPLNGRSRSFFLTEVQESGLSD
ncbi:hypothetical protein OSH93_25305, partial [Mycobacterium ulcerans]|nr:hypothetical protein [Mycobacterium ulcerans]